MPCLEALVVTPASDNCGSWSSPCKWHIEIDCPNPRCYWYDRETELRKSITFAALERVQRDHDKYARHAAAERERQRVRDAVAALQATQGESDV